MKPTAPAKSAARASAMPVTREEYQTLAAFRYRLRLFLHFSEEAARQAGLTGQQHQALLAVMGFPGPDPITVGELAERLQVAHHSAVGLVDRLVAKKLLLRKPGAEDARRVHLSLSARGRQVLDRLTATHQEELRRLGIPI